MLDGGTRDGVIGTGAMGIKIVLAFALVRFMLVYDSDREKLGATSRPSRSDL